MVEEEAIQEKGREAAEVQQLHIMGVADQSPF